MKKYLKEITIKEFKTLKNKHFKLSNKLNVITGANGTGKTTLLESIIYAFKENVVCNFDVRPFDRDTIDTTMILNDGTTINKKSNSRIEDLVIFVLDNCGCDLPQNKIKKYAEKLKKESKHNQIILATYQQEIIDIADNIIKL